MSEKARKKQTEATLHDVCSRLRAGVPFAHSCKAAGISKQTGHVWRSAGWESIESADEDSDAPLPFVARFAVAVESALVEYMAPFLKRITDELEGSGKGDWKVCQSILAARFPDSFSEKTHVAKSQRVEVSGQIDVNHRHSYQEFLAFRNMSKQELLFEIEKMDSRKNFERLEGEVLDAAIAVAESKLAGMIEARDSGHGFMPCNWNTGAPAIRPTVPEAIELDVTEYKELAAVSGAAPVGLAPNAAGAELILSSAPATPPLSSGFAFDAATGLAYHPPVEDEDLTL